VTLKILYVCGPMSGYDEYNWPSFKDATRRLREAGYEVRCPTESGAAFDLPWDECLKLSIKAMMDCNALALLPNWEDSRGAAIEIDLAGKLDMAIRPLDHWLRPAIVTAYTGKAGV
jgi:uncharacterized protein DUF4406